MSRFKLNTYVVDGRELEISYSHRNVEQTTYQLIPEPSNRYDAILVEGKILMAHVFNAILDLESEAFIAEAFARLQAFEKHARLTRLLEKDNGLYERKLADGSYLYISPSRSLELKRRLEDDTEELLNVFRIQFDSLMGLHDTVMKTVARLGRAVEE